MTKQDTFYCEPNGCGGMRYWSYSEGLIVYLNAQWAKRQIQNKSAKLVRC
jgi:hypothetical protein